MDFSLPPELEALRDRTRAFIAEQVIPLGSGFGNEVHGPSAALRAELVERARRTGLLTPHASRELVGLAHGETPAG